jgi:hypothetical protein
VGGGVLGIKAEDLAKLPFGDNILPGFQRFLPALVVLLNLRRVAGLGRKPNTDHQAPRQTNVPYEPFTHI